jgi:hypothetical protein
MSLCLLVDTQLSALKFDGIDLIEYYEVRLYLNLYNLNNFSNSLSPEKNAKSKCLCYSIFETLRGIRLYKKFLRFHAIGMHLSAE